MTTHSIIYDAISELRNRWGCPCDDVIDVVEVVYGRSSFQPAIDRKHNRRVDAIEKRPNRKRHSKAYYQRLFDDQKGNCRKISRACSGRLLTPAKKNEIDHIDPNAAPEVWDTRANHQLLCPACNREKSSMSLEDQAKSQGKTFVELLEQEER
jgi:5-methylcytosine-specific restriction endonuclease McrA